jgi:anti-sigma factor RsiW
MASSPETCSFDETVAEELIIGYTAGTLEPQAAVAFERHLSLCSRCRRLAAEQRAVWSALDAWQPAAVSPDFDQRLSQRIADSRLLFSRLSAFARSIWRPALPLAICAALAGIFLLRDSGTGSRAVDIRSSARIEQQVEHALDDMDMLKQIGADVTVDHARTPSRKI